MEAILTHASWALGLDAEELTAWQMGLRAMIVYIIGVVLIRLGEKRFIGKFSAFDVIVAIMIGSVLSRAIRGARASWCRMAKYRGTPCPFPHQRKGFDECIARERRRG